MNTTNETPIRTVYINIETNTTLVKTLLGIANAINGFFAALYTMLALVLLVGGMPWTTGEARSNQMLGSLIIIAWCGTWFVLGLKGYKSINKLRQECLTAYKGMHNLMR